MPELPEVETIKNDLAKNVVGREITGVEFLWPGILKETTLAQFEKAVVGQKITGAQRRAKNLALEISDGQNLLFHMKMTGHLIFTDDTWQVDKNGKWIKQNEKESPLYDPLNQYIRMVFYLSGDKILAFSDLRKFAYLKLLTKEELDKAFSEYGPEPLSKDFTEDVLAKILAGKKTAIKKVLMDQSLIAGIGNIYADEALYEAKIHPLEPASNLNQNDVMRLYKAIKDILETAVRLRGTSTSDFRDTEGRMGKYGDIRKVYRRTGLPCPNGEGTVKRITVGGRGTHFCPTEQRLKSN